MKRCTLSCLTLAVTCLSILPFEILEPSGALAQSITTLDRHKHPKSGSGTTDDKPRLVRTKSGTIVVSDASAEPADPDDVESIPYKNTSYQIISWVGRDGIVRSQLTQETMEALEEVFGKVGDGGIIDVIDAANKKGARLIHEALRLDANLQMLGDGNSGDRVLQWLRDEPTPDAADDLLKEGVRAAFDLPKGLVDGVGTARDLLRIAADCQALGKEPGGITQEFVDEYRAVKDGRKQAEEFIQKWASPDAPWGPPPGATTVSSGPPSTGRRTPGGNPVTGRGPGDGRGPSNGQPGNGNDGGSQAGSRPPRSPNDDAPGRAGPGKDAPGRAGPGKDAPGGASPGGGGGAGTGTPSGNGTGTGTGTAGGGTSGGAGAGGGAATPNEQAEDPAQHGWGVVKGVVTHTTASGGTAGTAYVEFTNMPGYENGEYIVVDDGQGNTTVTGPSGQTATGESTEWIGKVSDGWATTGQVDSATGLLIWYGPDSGDDQNTGDGNSQNAEYTPKDGGRPLPEDIELSIRLTLSRLSVHARGDTWRGFANVGSNNTTPDPTSDQGQRQRSYSIVELLQMADAFRDWSIGNPGTADNAAPRDKPNDLAKPRPDGRSGPEINPERDH